MVWLPISSTTWFLFVVLVHLDCFDSFLADNILDSNACQTIALLNSNEFSCTLLFLLACPREKNVTCTALDGTGLRFCELLLLVACMLYNVICCMIR
jgi:hypothetical protein